MSNIRSIIVAFSSILSLSGIVLTGCSSTPPVASTRDGNTTASRTPATKLDQDHTKSEQPNETLDTQEIQASHSLSGEESVETIQSPETSTSTAVFLIENIFLKKASFSSLNHAMEFEAWMETLPRPDAFEIFSQLIQRNYLKRSERQKVENEKVILSSLSAKINQFKNRLSIIRDPAEIQATESSIAQIKKEMEKHQNHTYEINIKKSIVMEQVKKILTNYHGENPSGLYEFLLSSKDSRVQKTAFAALQKALDPSHSHSSPHSSTTTSLEEVVRRLTQSKIRRVRTMSMRISKEKLTNSSEEEEAEEVEETTKPIACFIQHLEQDTVTRWRENTLNAIFKECKVEP